jgi:Nuclease-related domain
MAWPKLRNPKSTGPLVVITERNGVGRPGRAVNPDGAQQVNPPTTTPLPAEPDPGAEQAGPPAWPGVVLPSQRHDGEPAPGEPAAQEPAADAPSFWDWAPADDVEDERFSIDTEPDAVGAGVPGSAGGRSDAAPAGGATQTEGPAFVEDRPAAGEGIGQRLGPLNHIFDHSRMGLWRRRAVIAVVVGVVITILVNWQVGVTLAVLAAIADTIYRSRTVVVPATTPGAPRMTKAQRQTYRQLSKLERSGYKALHSRLIPESEDQIDHLVIGPAGVFSIDSEWWDKQLPIRTKNARQLWHGPFSMKDRLEHARWESEQAAELLTRAVGHKVSVRPAMAVYGPKIPWDIATIRDVDVFSGARLRVYLRRYARQNSARPLDQTEIDRIYTAAHTAFPHQDPAVAAS